MISDTTCCKPQWKLHAEGDYSHFMEHSFESVCSMSLLHVECALRNVLQGPLCLQEQFLPQLKLFPGKVRVQRRVACCNRRNPKISFPSTNMPNKDTSKDRKSKLYVFAAKRSCQNGQSPGTQGVRHCLTEPPLLILFLFAQALSFARLIDSTASRFSFGGYNNIYNTYIYLNN